MWQLVVFFISTNAIVEDEGVWVLGDNDFDKAFEVQKNLLVEFYAPWCRHCQILAPEYSEAARRLKLTSPQMFIAKVDATVNVALAKRFGIKEYPTLKYFVNASPLEYTGGRTADEIVKWVMDRNLPSFRVIGSLVEIEKFIGAYRIAAVLFSALDSIEAKAFEEASKKFESIGFAVSTSREAIIHYNINTPSLVLFKQFDDKRVDFIGKFTQTEITKFVEDNRLPWILPFGDEAIKAIFNEGSAGLFFFVESFHDYKEVLEKIAKEVKGILVVCYADLRADSSAKLAEFLGISPEEQPLSLIIDPRNGLKKHKSSELLNESGLRKFIQDWQKGKLEVYYKSEPEPINSYDNHVRIVVGSTFDSIVLNSKKDVLILFYTPWCELCKKLAPDYEKLAFSLKSNPNLIISKFDASSNEIKHTTPRSFPSIRLYPSNLSPPIDFFGERSYSGLLNFLQTHTPLSLPNEDL